MSLSTGQYRTCSHFSTLPPQLGWRSYCRSYYDLSKNILLTLSFKSTNNRPARLDPRLSDTALNQATLLIFTSGSSLTRDSKLLFMPAPSYWSHRRVDRNSGANSQQERSIRSHLIHIAIFNAAYIGDSATLPFRRSHLVLQSRFGTEVLFARLTFTVR